MSGITPRQMSVILALRGLAASVIALVFHYRHFAPNGNDTIIPYFIDIFPISMGYHYGFLTVDLFFILSGLTLTEVYFNAIRERRISGVKFFWLRWTRLYPLHLTTLIVVATGLWLFDLPPFYPNNDLYHFILNLFFIQSGWIDRGFSFNGPAWSLAIEAIVYTIFFFIARTGSRRLLPFGLLMAGVTILVLVKQTYSAAFFCNESVGRGVAGFFLGMLIHAQLSGRMGRYRPLALLLGVTIVLSFQADSLLALLSHLDPQLNIIGWLITWSTFTILIFVTTTNDAIGRWLTLGPFIFLGNISLSVYLIHVPIQMILIAMFTAAGTVVPYLSLLFWMVYSAMVILVSAVAFYWFERPVKVWLRRDRSSTNPTGSNVPMRGV